MELKPEEITKIIRSQIKNYENKIEVSETGVVILVGDGIAKASGLEKCMAGELVEFPDGSYGMAQNLEEDTVSIVILGSDQGIKEGDTVKRTGRVVSVPVGEELIGRVVNALGEPIDGKGPALRRRPTAPIEMPAPGIIERQHVSPRPCRPVSRPSTRMIPIGRGQRELIIGDRQTGKTTIATDTILNQKGKDVHLHLRCHRSEASPPWRRCVDSLHRRRRNGLHHRGLRHRFRAGAHAVYRPLCRLHHGANTSCIKARTCWSFTTIFRKHAVAYRALSLLIRRPPGREAYPGDVFYLHSRLLERAGQLSPDAWAAAVLTALPIIETQAGDVSAYIPTNVISITDGQIFLETELFNAGVLPAVNPGISVSRVGGNAQIKAMKKVAGTLKLLYSQYRELQAFAQFGSDLDADTKSRLALGERIVAVLKQKNGSPKEVAQQVCIIYAVTHGYLTSIPVAQIPEFEKRLEEHMNNHHADVLEAIRSTGKLETETENALKAALDELVAEFQA